jgi:UDP-N-acetylmuramate: L-alanyl-gamma-D-glutamyl-meso-diaminopimelate ligase
MSGPALAAPPAPRERVHFIGICGKGMGAVALALSGSGWRVTGSDEGAYPPMTELLAAAGVPVASPYAAANIPADADLIVVGKRVRDDNPELRAAVAGGRPRLSFPALLRTRFLRHSRNAVVAGGLGKSTTTAILAWILEHAGLAPDYLIGAAPRNLDAPARFRGAGIAVIEGDEYASSCDDPRPKFMHYCPEVAVITNVVEDHPDLYPDLAAVEAVFAGFAEMLPATGCLVIPDDDESAERVARGCRGRLRRVGFLPAAGCRVDDLRLTSAGSEFRLAGTRFRLPLFGRMNVRNAAMAAVAAAELGVPWRVAAEAAACFAGVGGRQQAEVVGRQTVVVDKATHPVALRGLLEAVRQQYPGRRVVSVIQPRATGGRQWVYQRGLPGALAGADAVVVLHPYEHAPPPGRPWQADPFSAEELVSDLSALGVRAASVAAAGEAAALSAALGAIVEAGDVVVLTLPEQAREMFAAITQAVAAAESGGGAS